VQKYQLFWSVALAIGLMVGGQTFGPTTVAQIQIGTTPTPLPTSTPDESYLNKNLYVDPELGWSISWPDDAGLVPLATDDGRFILRNSKVQPEIYFWIMNIEPKAGTRSAMDKVQDCLDGVGSYADSSVLEGPDGELLSEISDKEGWAVFGYTDEWTGPKTTYAHCWIVPSESKIVLFRGELGSPADFNKRSYLVDELVNSFTLPGEQ
jgi:hypothetical protein